MAASTINPTAPTVPALPAVLHITDDELFGDDAKADAWYDSVLARRSYIAELVESYTALYLVNPAAPADYYIISPSVKGLGFKYQITKFDAEGAVYDAPGNTGLEIADEVPDEYILLDIIQ